MGFGYEALQVTYTREIRIQRDSSTERDWNKIRENDMPEEEGAAVKEEVTWSKLGKRAGVRFRVAREVGMLGTRCPRGEGTMICCRSARGVVVVGPGTVVREAVV
jgi:hypothetical protein